MNNRSNFKFSWHITLALVALACLCPIDFSLAVNNPNDSIQTTYEPVTFSKTEIINGEVFYATIKTKGVCLQDLPRPSKAARFSYRYFANNKATGEELVLNSAFNFKIEPYPQKKGETYQISNKVPLQFPDGSKAGDYMIIEELVQKEMKAPQIGWQNALDPARPPEPRGLGIVKYSPEEPASVSEPAIEPEPEPAMEPEPALEPESEPAVEPELIIEPETPTPAPKPELAPKLAPASSNPTLSALTISPDSVTGGASLVGTVKVNKISFVSWDVQLSATPGTSLTLPSSITVKGGTTASNFNISTKVVTSPVKVTIMAALNKSQKTTQLTINPFTVSALTLSSASVINGDPLTGMVTLNAAAPASGLIVQLSVAPGASLTIPASVKVEAGATSGTFSIPTKTVTSPVKVVIMAKLNNSKQTAELTINPTPALDVSGLAVSPASLTGGASSVGMVTLNIAAPVGGQVVQLSATPGDSLTIPASVKVEAGATSATFDILTKKVTSTVNVIITAKLNNSKTQQTASLAINPEILSCAGFCTASFCPYGYDTISQGTDCKPVETSCRRCGWFWSKQCCSYTPTVCCVLKVSSVTLAISPSSVINGDSSTATVTLSSVAPAGGQAVKLSANSGAPVIIPDSVTVPAGATSATFEIKTKIVSSPVNATITATLNNYGGSVQLIINPTPVITVSALTVSPDSVINGTPASGTVTLNRAASTGGQAIVLSANPGDAVALPARIIVKAGETSGTFEIQTKKVTAPVKVTITASPSSLLSNNFYKIAQLTINPTPNIFVSALTVKPAAVIGGDPSVGTVTLSGPAPISGQVVQLSANPGAPLAFPASMTIKAGETFGIFNIPTNAVTSPANATITATINNSQKTAPLTINPMPAFCPYNCRPATRQSSGWSSSWVTKCQSNEIAVQSSCPQTTQPYSCGIFGWRTCYAQVRSICCKSK